MVYSTSRSIIRDHRGLCKQSVELQSTNLFSPSQHHSRVDVQLTAQFSANFQRGLAKTGILRGVEATKGRAGQYINSARISAAHIIILFLYDYSMLFLSSNQGDRFLILPAETQNSYIYFPNLYINVYERPVTRDNCRGPAPSSIITSCTISFCRSLEYN